MEPILKWAGGKRLLKDKIIKYIDTNKMTQSNSTYFEPFIGGGAILLALEYKKCCINDCNKDLINFYIQVKENPKELINKLKEYKTNYSEQFYEKIKSIDRNKNYDKLSCTEKAARFIFLNKTCYNGLYRVNSQGYFNVPIGKYKNPDFICEKKILELSRYLNNNEIIIKNCDFESAVKDAKNGDFIYFDPPYDYDGNGFTSYSANGFSRNDLIRLKELCDRLIEKGCTVLISNNDTEIVNKTFSGNNYSIEHILANRFISCDGKNRSKVNEVLIYGKK